METLSYNPLTGLFLWLKAPSFRVKQGDVAGCLSNGYYFITLDGYQAGAHRWAVYYMTGLPPVGEVDHRNGVGSDNRYLNLRDGTHQENMQNEQRARKNNKTGFLGVSLCKKTGRFRSFISVNSKSRTLGRFATPQAAHGAYLLAKRSIHKGNTL